MSDPLFYREIQFSRLGGTLPEKVGSFVVGIPTEVVKAYRKEHAADTTDAAFRDLISDQEIEQMKKLLGRLNLSLGEQIPFTGDPISLGTPTFEGEGGKKFWSILVAGTHPLR
ncbi:MAG: hypothetical protein JO170_02115 [Verrucomicrobia bacterium]|nr:hypothetical protein [Verrucomicrobiota bacterium]